MQQRPADKINAFSDTVLMDKLFNNPALPQSLCEMLQSKLDTYQTASTGQKNSEFKRNVASAMEPSVSLLDAEDGGKQAGPGQT